MQHTHATAERQESLKARAAKVLERNTAVRHPRDTGNKDVLHAFATCATPCNTETPEQAAPQPAERPATCLAACLEQDGVLIHAKGCPTVKAVRRGGKNCAWFEQGDPDPVGDAVSSLLKPGEYLDAEGKIRRVQ